MKSIGVYGSEVKNKGFSGYLTELLIVYYKSFENVLKNSSIWKKKTEIDLNKHKSKVYNEPLVVIDPTDSNRNVASSLSLDKLSIFIDSSRSFILNPNISFFKYNNLEYSLDQVLELINIRETSYFILFFKIDTKKTEDIIYPQIDKTRKSIINLLMKNDFNCFGSKIIILDNQCYIFFELDYLILNNIHIVNGPSIWNIKNSFDFKNKHSNSNLVYSLYIENGYYKIKTKRKFKDAIKLIENNISSSISFGKDIKSSFLKNHQFITDLKNINVNEEHFKIFLRNIYDYLKYSSS